MAADPFRPRSPLSETHSEERASMWSHAAGTVFALGTLALMIRAAGGDPLGVAAGAIFGVTLALLYLSSTLYHACTSLRMKSALQLVDHACIYLLIAGSYTPLTLVGLRGAWGWWLFGIIWFLALAGVLLKSFSRSRRESKTSTALYLLMGWLVVVAARPLIDAIPPAGLLWLVAGGLNYTVGVIFFAWRRLPFNHTVWHLFVLAGSACHVVATVRYILPAPDA